MSVRTSVPIAWIPAIIPISDGRPRKQLHPVSAKRESSSAQQVSITANKVRGIRCALCHNTTTARLTREHNDANMLAIGASMVGEIVALDIVDTFFATEFSHGERHQRRIDKIEG